MTVDKVVNETVKFAAKSFSVDFMPTTMLKFNVYIMATLITRLANVSFSTGVLPSALKQGRVTPLLKKPGLLPSDTAN